jgi:Protein of unknown function (DUF4011)
MSALSINYRVRLLNAYDVFRTALKEAKAVDPEWLAAEDAKRAAGNRRRSKDRAAERSLRDRVRKQLGMPEWRAATDPKVRAQELGIDPSYDLKADAKGGDVAAGQPKIQTLFFPDRLEPKLSAIHAAARTLQEDAGISALSCAVGFLEWYETDDGPTPAYAPLLLLPINMEKRVAGGEYVFSIVGRDDDETTNVALREKLRQHGIELPEYDPEHRIGRTLADQRAIHRVLCSSSKYVCMSCIAVPPVRTAYPVADLRHHLSTMVESTAPARKRRWTGI